MTSNGKGVPVPVLGSRAVLSGIRKPQELRISTYTATAPDAGQKDGKASVEPKSFMSGNPDVEITKGILHLYKDNDRLFMEPGSKAIRSDMLCIMAIPNTVSCTELLTFVASFKDSIEHIKIICDNSPTHYMALLKFKEQVGADGFFSEFNGKKYNSLEEDICWVAFVSRVETVKQSDGGGLPISGHTELPTCPVCLERMDESVDGLLTILCNHSFHTSCLIKWSESGCPVCRYIQTPEMVTQNACSVCNSKDQLWICLICGHVGCGRYLHGHAYKHFCETEHAFAIQPDNNRVWDYSGDNFVHRLFQNKGDGKLVDAPGRRFEGDVSGLELEEAEEKVDNMQLEFTHMLTSQLEAQRNYFEERLKRSEMDKKDEVQSVIHKLETERTTYDTKIREALHEKKEMEKKFTKLSSKFEQTLRKWDEQVVMTKVLTEDLNFCKNRLQELEKKYDELKTSSDNEIKELNETIRDLSIYIQTEKVISDSPFAEEVRTGSVSVPTQLQPKPSSSKLRKKPGK